VSWVAEATHASRATSRWASSKKSASAPPSGGTSRSATASRSRSSSRVARATWLKGRKLTSLSTDAIIHKGATLVGAYGVDARAYLDAIRIIESGRFPLPRMHTHTFGLAEAQRAVEVLAGEVPGEEAVHVAIDPLL
jgi:threonine dehydrogenase-like Zn-dependent dehydrogenase